MVFPDKIEGLSMEGLVRMARSVGMRELYLRDGMIVSSMSEALWVSFYDSGKIKARYKLNGDGTWRRIDSPPPDSDP